MIGDGDVYDVESDLDYITCLGMSSNDEATLSRMASEESMRDWELDVERQLQKLWYNRHVECEDQQERVTPIPLVYRKAFGED
uniref:Uncharacterized protein n=1 Tax=viral metagenome TaxID=1070528 RepID=A0A6M3JK80_9ZZZZ